MNYALLLSSIVFLLASFILYKLIQELGLIISFLVASSIYLLITRKYRRREKWYRTHFPQAWKSIIEQKVRYYKELTVEEQEEFCSRCFVFIKEKRIIGIETEITDEIRIFVAASAMIPVMAFDEFEYDQVNEVLIYPKLFDKNYQFKKGKADQANISGMVGNGPMKGVVIFSKPDLVKAYDGKAHSFNVGIHEFTHLIDGADGTIDGVPESIIDKAYILPWISLIEKESRKIARNRSDINKYALTNQQEFLSVVSEYFFSAPKKFKKNHPELFVMMSNMFKTDTVSQHMSILLEIVKGKSF